MDGSTLAKLIVACILFLTWAGLVAFHVSGSDAIVSFIQCSLTALGGYHVGQAPSSAPSPGDKQ